MDFAFDLIKKIPSGWPRILALVAIPVLYFFFPSVLNKLSRGRKEKEELDRVTRYLQVKKLILETDVLQREKNLSGISFPGEEKLLADLKKSGEQARTKEQHPYHERLKYCLLGAGAFFLITSLFAFHRFQEGSTGWNIAVFFFRDFLFSAVCGLVSSLIPLGRPRTSFFYGLTMPLALVLIFVTVTR